MAKMKCPEGGTSCYVGGIEYTANKKGEVNVPDEYIGDLQSHGYTLIGDSNKKDAIVAAKKKVDELDAASNAAMEANKTSNTPESATAEASAIDAYNAAVDELDELEK